jgi:hypothetical protein
MTLLAFDGTRWRDRLPVRPDGAPEELACPLSKM